MPPEDVELLEDELLEDPPDEEELLEVEPPEDELLELEEEPPPGTTQTGLSKLLPALWLPWKPKIAVSPGRMVLVF